MKSRSRHMDFDYKNDPHQVQKNISENSKRNEMNKKEEGRREVEHEEIIQKKIENDPLSKITGNVNVHRITLLKMNNFFSNSIKLFILIIHINYN